jgi:hypothetical protein
MEPRSTSSSCARRTLCLVPRAMPESGLQRTNEHQDMCFGCHLNNLTFLSRLLGESVHAYRTTSLVAPALPPPTPPSSTYSKITLASLSLLAYVNDNLTYPAICLCPGSPLLNSLFSAQRPNSFFCLITCERDHTRPYYLPLRPLTGLSCSAVDSMGRPAPIQFEEVAPAAGPSAAEDTFVNDVARANKRYARHALLRAAVAVLHMSVRRCTKGCYRCAIAVLFAVAGHLSAGSKHDPVNGSSMCVWRQTDARVAVHMDAGLRSLVCLQSQTTLASSSLAWCEMRRASGKRCNAIRALSQALTFMMTQRWQGSKIALHDSAQRHRLRT